MKKDLVIVVPGTKTLSSWKRPWKRLIEEIAHRLRIYGLVKKDYVSIWRRKLAGKNRKIITLHWSRLPELVSLKKAEEKLSRFIKKYSKKSDIFLVGISLGGKIVFDVVKISDTEKIKKVFLVAAVGIEDKCNSKIPIINFYSDKDSLAEKASEIIRPFDKFLKIEGKNIKNFNLPLDHKGFCSNQKIKKGKFKGKTIIEIIKKMLK